MTPTCFSKSWAWPEAFFKLELGMTPSRKSHWLSGSQPAISRFSNDSGTSAPSQARLRPQPLLEVVTGTGGTGPGDSGCQAPGRIRGPPEPGPARMTGDCPARQCQPWPGCPAPGPGCRVPRRSLRRSITGRGAGGPVRDPALGPQASQRPGPTRSLPGSGRCQAAARLVMLCRSHPPSEH
jgi:hypothetical protein